MFQRFIRSRLNTCRFSCRWRTGPTVCLVTMAYIFAIASFFLVVFYLYLHSLPERMAHGQDRTQFQIVAILALLALFTHNNAFWVASLLLAALTVPDFLTPVTSAARSLAAMTGRDYEGDTREDDPTHDDPDAPDAPDAATSPVKEGH